MKKVTHLFAGAAIGAGIGLALEVCGAIISCVTCSDSDSVPLMLPLAIVGAVIGFIVGAFKDSEEAEAVAQRNAQQKQYEADQRYQGWTNELGNYLNSIINSTLEVNASFNAENLYSGLSAIKAKEDKSDSRYQQTYQTLMTDHLSRLKNNLCTLLCGSEKDEIETNLMSLLFGSNIIQCINIIDHSEKTEEAEKTINNAISIVIQLPLMYLEQNEYGDFKLKMDDPDEFQKVSDWIAAGGMDKLYGVINRMSDSYDSMIDVLAEGKLLNLLKTSATTMWYYAKLKPFNVDKLNEAIAIFNRYTVKNDLPKVEVLLARIYAKNQLGGVELVRQEQELIDGWVEKIREFSYEDCTLLASGLAWMELYDIELRVLRKLVELGVQLPADIQERLTFLESGGTSNIKIYTVEPSHDFLFDNSSLEWNSKDYSVFFRKLAMKKMQINYSLAYSKWTKNLPLLSGQTISREKLYSEFASLVKDFDGEMSFSTSNAHAIDLLNVEYKDAAIFKFNNSRERCRCISIVFSCEKFGRNLNITMITMFTPDNTYSPDELERYCTAIKDNMYVESFRESIAQVVDEVLNPRQSAYEDTIVPNKKNMFD